MKKNRVFNVAWIVIMYVAILGVTIFCNIYFNNSFKEKSPKFDYYAWIVVESFALLIILLLYVIAISLQNKDYKNWKEKLIYAVITINPYWFVDDLIIASKKGLFTWRLQKWNTIDYPLIAIAICLYMVLATIDKMLIPVVPILFISLSLEYIAIFFIAWITRSFLKTLLTGFLCGMFLLALPTTYFINFGQFCFDYLFDNMVVAFAAFVVVKKFERNNPFRWLSFFTMPYILVFWSRVIAGVIFYGSFSWPDFPVFLYSVIINEINTFCDYIVMIIIGPIIFARLYVLEEKYQTKNKARKVRV